MNVPILNPTPISPLPPISSKKSSTPPPPTRPILGKSMPPFLKRGEGSSHYAFVTCTFSIEVAISWNCNLKASYIKKIKINKKNTTTLYVNL